MRTGHQNGSPGMPSLPTARRFGNNLTPSFPTIRLASCEISPLRMPTCLAIEIFLPISLPHRNLGPTALDLNNARTSLQCGYLSHEPCLEHESWSKLISIIVRHSVSYLAVFTLSLNRIYPHFSQKLVIIKEHPSCLCRNTYRITF